MTALRTCPHCFAPVRSNGRPSCLCAAADAEDFDPLHIRPYVSLPDEDEGDGERNQGRGEPNRAGSGHPARGDRLDEIPGVDAAVHRADDRALRTEDPPSAAEAPPPVTARARRRAGPTSRTFSAVPEEPASSTATEEPTVRSSAAGHTAPAPARRPRALPALLATAGAAVAATAVLIGTDALTGGEQDRAAPPDTGTVSPTAAFPTGGDASPTPSGSPSSPTPARSPSGGATALGTPESTATLFRSAAPHPPAPTQASGRVTDSPDDQRPSSAPTGPIVLREGSSGPEVTELQERLRQLALYPGAPNGQYDAAVRDAVARYQQAYGVTGDAGGVYGTSTRSSLEARTQEP
ncbi:peptidoglycan-binding domain-containing protein [Streptomyces sp. NPDC048506]|uniref:peptidoglycan-binding domain-containing protein n=1 Tax=Streptomyces sp. NPDC048506 TaxID=3155028 RepID=UPI00341FB7BF